MKAKARCQPCRRENLEQVAEKLSKKERKNFENQENLGEIQAHPGKFGTELDPITVGDCTKDFLYD